MIIQGSHGAVPLAGRAAPAAQSRHRATEPASGERDRLTLSDAARCMAGTGAGTGGAASGDVQLSLDAIKAKPAVQRTPADQRYLAEHDQRLNEIQEKIKADGSESLCADDVDYLQQAMGLVNTMACLSPQERALYDDLTAEGHHEAASALMLVGMARIGMEGQQVSVPGGRSFDPQGTALSPDSVRNLFKQMFVDASGPSNAAFDALAAALEARIAPPGGAAHAPAGAAPR